MAGETRERVLQAVAQLGYVPDRVAGSLSSRRTGFVAAILPTLMNANFSDTAHGLTETLLEQDYQLLIGYTLYRLEDEERLIRAMLARRPEALVLTGATHTREAARLLLDLDIPVVEIWDLPERPVGHAVGFSNFEAGRMAARHLAALGHRRIGAIGPAPGGRARDFRGEERLDGFTAGLRELGLIDPPVERHSGVPLSFIEGAEAMAGLLDRMPGIEAVFTISDPIGVGAMMECQRRGIRVPDQVSIMGFGDFEIGRQCVPALTTIQVDARGIGRQAGRVLLQVLGGAALEPEPAAASTDLGIELVIRGSTRPRLATAGFVAEPEPDPMAVTTPERSWLSTPLPAREPSPETERPVTPLRRINLGRARPAIESEAETAPRESEP